MLRLGMAGAHFLANAAEASPSMTRAGDAFVRQDDASARPAAGTEPQTRGEGGELRIIQWQASSHLSPHHSTGTKEWLASPPLIEPLMFYLPDATLTPNLITEIPTIESGLLAKDLKSVTYKLLPGVV